ncbi:MAG TPA: hypothetical protein PLN42_11750 [Anaerolineae bacterium]|nr:hypothetical protein [Anaerolineae bacterium]
MDTDAQARGTVSHAPHRPWLTIDQAAPLLGLTPAGLRARIGRAARAGAGPVHLGLVTARKLGASWRVRIDEEGDHA